MFWRSNYCCSCVLFHLWNWRSINYLRSSDHHGDLCHSTVDHTVVWWNCRCRWEVMVLILSPPQHQQLLLSPHWAKQLIYARRVPEWPQAILLSSHPWFISRDGPCPTPLPTVEHLAWWSRRRELHPVPSAVIRGCPGHGLRESWGWVAPDSSHDPWGVPCETMWHWPSLGAEDSTLMDWQEHSYPCAPQQTAFSKKSLE